MKSNGTFKRGSCQLHHCQWTRNDEKINRWGKLTHMVRLCEQSSLGKLDLSTNKLVSDSNENVRYRTQYFARKRETIYRVMTD